MQLFFKFYLKSTAEYMYLQSKESLPDLSIYIKAPNKLIESERVQWRILKVGPPPPPNFGCKTSDVSYTCTYFPPYFSTRRILTIEIKKTFKKKYIYLMHDALVYSTVVSVVYHTLRNFCCYI
jgi:hypothetical protein